MSSKSKTRPQFASTYNGKEILRLTEAQYGPADSQAKPTAQGLSRLEQIQHACHEQQERDRRVLLQMMKRGRPHEARGSFRRTSSTPSGFQDHFKSIHFVGAISRSEAYQDSIGLVSDVQSSERQRFGWQRQITRVDVTKPLQPIIKGSVEMGNDIVIHNNVAIGRSANEISTQHALWEEYQKGKITPTIQSPHCNQRKTFRHKKKQDPPARGDAQLQTQPQPRFSKLRGRSHDGRGIESTKHMEQETHKREFEVLQKLKALHNELLVTQRDKQIAQQNRKPLIQELENLEREACQMEILKNQKCLQETSAEGETKVELARPFRTSITEPPVMLESCSCCGRTFMKERLIKHVEICKKITQKKRKVYNSSKARGLAKDMEKCMNKS